MSETSQKSTHVHTILLFYSQSNMNFPLFFFFFSSFLVMLKIHHLPFVHALLRILMHVKLFLVKQCTFSVAPWFAPWGWGDPVNTAQSHHGRRTAYELATTENKRLQLLHQRYFNVLLNVKLLFICLTYWKCGYGSVVNEAKHFSTFWLYII